MDTVRMIKWFSRDPTVLPFFYQARESISEILPPVFALCIFGDSVLFLNSPEMLEEAYVNKNLWYTKHDFERQFIKMLVDSPITHVHTHDPTYVPRRKSLSQAFFKKKLVLMTKIIKEVTLEYIKQNQAPVVGESKTMDLCNFTLEMQSHVTISVLVGSGPSKSLIPYENPTTGEIKPVLVSSMINHIIEDITHRVENPINAFFPWMMAYRTTPFDFKFHRNILTLKSFLRGLIKERCQGTKKAAQFQEAGDMISILLEAEFYKDDHEAIIDEVIILFMAGMKTI